MLACNACNFEIFTNFLAKEQLHILMEACYFQARHNRWLLLQQVAFEMHWVLHVFSLFVTVLTEHVLFSQALHTATEMPWRLAWMTWLQLMAKGKETEFSSSFGYWDFEKLLRSIGASPNFGFIPPLPARAMKMALSCKLAIDQAKCKKLDCGGVRIMAFGTEQSWLTVLKSHGFAAFSSIQHEDFGHLPGSWTNSPWDTSLGDQPREKLRVFHVVSLCNQHGGEDIFHGCLGDIIHFTTFRWISAAEIYKMIMVTIPSSLSFSKSFWK